MWVIFKNQMLNFQSNASLDKRIVFGKINHCSDLEIRKMLVKACFGTKIPYSILVHDLRAIEIKILSLKMTMTTIPQAHLNGTLNRFHEAYARSSR